MAALLVTLAVMGVLLAVAVPSWRHQMQREREAELIFRGEQYARAVGLFQRKFAGAFPPSINVLLDQKFLRKKYRDPMVPDGEFQVLYQAQVAAAPGQVSAPGQPTSPGGPPAPRGIQAPPQGSIGSSTPGTTVGGTPGGPTGTAGPNGGIVGVVSKSRNQSMRLYNGRDRYSDWQFVFTAVTNQAGTPQAGPRPGRRIQQRLPNGGGGQGVDDAPPPEDGNPPTGGFGMPRQPGPAQPLSPRRPQ
jgi:type II secretory pathway pseudopilin PulG